MKRNYLNYSRIDDAKALIAKGDKIIEVNCQTCQGMGSGNPKSVGYCSVCNGQAYVKKPAWEYFGWESKVDYWQARALVAEAGE